MFDDDEDDGEQPEQVDLFGREDYGSGMAGAQRTNQAEMDQLMKPCLDYDDNDEEEDTIGSLLKPTLSGAVAKGLAPDDDE